MGLFGGIISGVAGGIAGGRAARRRNKKINRTLDEIEGDFGIPGFGDRQGRLLGAAEDFRGRGAPRAEGARLGRAQGFGGAQVAGSSFRGQQGDLGQFFFNQATGQGPSLAQEQLKQATDRNIAQQQALAAGARGGNAALAARQAAQNAATIGQEAAGQATQAGIQERLGAAQQAAGIFGQARGQDLQRNIQNAQLLQQAGIFTAEQANQFMLEQARLGQQNQQFNVDAALRQTGMNDQAFLELLRQEMSNAQAQQQGRQSFAGLKLGARSGQMDPLAAGLAGGSAGFAAGMDFEIPRDKDGNIKWF